MTTVDFITELFCKVDDLIGHEAKHSQANLYPSEVVTLALLYALTGKGQRAYWRWLIRDYMPLFPNLPCLRASSASLTATGTTSASSWRLHQ